MTCLRALLHEHGMVVLPRQPPSLRPQQYYEFGQKWGPVGLHIISLQPDEGGFDGLPGMITLSDGDGAALAMGGGAIQTSPLSILFSSVILIQNTLIRWIYKWRLNASTAHG